MSTIKTIGNSGQISLGKEFAGRTVIVDQPEPGVWIIKAGEFIPDNELWIQEPNAKAKIDKAIQWAAENLPQETNLGELETKMNSKKYSKRQKN